MLEVIQMIFLLKDHSVIMIDITLSLYYYNQFWWGKNEHELTNRIIHRNPEIKRMSLGHVTFEDEHAEFCYEICILLINVNGAAISLLQIRPARSAIKDWVKSIISLFHWKFRMFLPPPLPPRCRHKCYVPQWKEFYKYFFFSFTFPSPVVM